MWMCFVGVVVRFLDDKLDKLDKADAVMSQQPLSRKPTRIDVLGSNAISEQE
jgi:hypothetical protein